MPSFSRPSVSNANPFSESLFKTLRYCPQYPSQPFATLEDAKRWVSEFIHWYNTQHLHSAISFTTPMSRHNGDYTAILAKRDRVYKDAKQKYPICWSGKTRAREKITSVKLNSLKENVISDNTAVDEAS